VWGVRVWRKLTSGFSFTVEDPLAVQSRSESMGTGKRKEEKVTAPGYVKCRRETGQGIRGENRGSGKMNPEESKYRVPGSMWRYRVFLGTRYLRLRLCRRLTLCGCGSGTRVRLTPLIQLSFSLFSDTFSYIKLDYSQVTVYNGYWKHEVIL
jgi:hypothetical protein